MHVVFTIDGREAIPVRAIPFAVGSDPYGFSGLDAHAVALSAASHRDGVPLSQLLPTFRLSNGTTEPVSAQSWGRFLEAIEEGGRNEIEALPAGVFAWLDDVAAMATALAHQDDGSGVYPVQWPIDKNPIIKPASETCVLEGFEVTFPHAEERDTSERFAERQFKDGFHGATYALQSNEEPGRKRCEELARKDQLTSGDWVEITGAGLGISLLYEVTEDAVRFRKWDRDYIQQAPVTWQVEMLRDNELPALQFPCTPHELVAFVDSSSNQEFAVPAFFREVVEAYSPPASIGNLEPVTVNPQQKKKPGPKPKDMKGRLLRIVEALEEYASENKIPFDRMAMPGPLGQDASQKGSFRWLCASLDKGFNKGKSSFAKYKDGVCAVRLRAKPTDFYELALPCIKQKWEAIKQKLEAK